MDRMYASYIDAYHKNRSIPPFSSLVKKGMSRFSKYGRLRQILTNNTQSFQSEGDNSTRIFKSFIDLYYLNEESDGIGEDAVLIDYLFGQSIFVPVILHCIQALSVQRVLIVSLDQISSLSTSSSDTRNASLATAHVAATMQKVYSFLGLQAYHIPSTLLKPQRRENADDSSVRNELIRRIVSLKLH